MGSCSYSTECKKEVHYTLVHNTTITAVYNIHSGAQHIHDTETFRLPEHQVASTMILVLAGTLTLGVVVRGAKKHYKTEKTLSTLRPRNGRSLGRTAQDFAARLYCKSFYFIHA